MRSWLSVLIADARSKKRDDIPIAPLLYSLSNKMDNSLLAVRDINHKYIVVGKYRRIFLPKVLQRKLLSYCHNNQIAEGWIFVTKNGKLKDRSNIWREMKRLKEKAGVAESKIFPHNFRHLFARIYYKVTKDITGLADLLGHSSINVTRIYTATTETVFQKKLDKIVEQEILECTT